MQETVWVQRVLEHAVDARLRAHAPYSNFRVARQSSSKVVRTSFPDVTLRTPLSVQRSVPSASPYLAHVR